MTASTTTAGVLSNIFTAPQAAFGTIKERPRPWLPLLLIILSICIVQFTYMQVVDLAWFIDSQLATSDLPIAQREQAVDSALQIPQWLYGFIAAGPTAVMIIAVYALIALYYTAVSFASNDGVKFGQWFGLIAWCSLPSVFGQLASLVNLAVVDARFLLPQQLNPLSFSSLLGIDPTGATMVESILLSLDVTTLWSTVLQILGYQAFTQSSAVKAALVVLGPLALIVLLGSL
jgi:hypothetical protein